VFTLLSDRNPDLPTHGARVILTCRTQNSSDPTSARTPATRLSCKACSLASLSPALVASSRLLSRAAVGAVLLSASSVPSRLPCRRSTLVARAPSASAAYRVRVHAGVDPDPVGPLGSTSMDPGRGRPPAVPLRPAMAAFLSRSWHNRDWRSMYERIMAGESAPGRDRTCDHRISPRRPGGRPVPG
jgi:hypothetical protein